MPERINDFRSDQRNVIVLRNKSEGEKIVSNIESLKLIEVGELEKRIDQINDMNEVIANKKKNTPFNQKEEGKETLIYIVILVIIGMVILSQIKFTTYVGMFLAHVVVIAAANMIPYFLYFKRKKDKAQNIEEYAHSQTVDNEKMISELTKRKLNMTNMINDWIEQVQKYYSLKTKSDIEKYDLDVETYCFRIIKNRAAIDPMIKYCADRFESRIKNADKGSHLKYIEAEFVYKVESSRILFFNKNGYLSEQETFSFNSNPVKRFSNLGSPEECEGMTGAIAFLTAAEIEKRHPKAHVKKNHNDCIATLKYSMINNNYQQTVKVT